MSDHEETGLLKPQGNMKSSLSQVVLLSCVCFCVPGMWNSITSMAVSYTHLTLPTSAIV